jgi:hypothetical protein
MVAAKLVNEAEAGQSIIGVGKAFKERPGGRFRFVELCSLDEIEDGVGCDGEGGVAVVAEAEMIVGRRRRDSGEGLDCRLGIRGEAAALVLLAAAAGAGIIAPDLGHISTSEGRVPLYQTLLADARLHRVLLAIDEDLAAECRTRGCGACGGALHSAWFRRKPRGGPAELGEAFDRRFSFCCAERECRKRATPSSLRFLGRRIYLAVVVTLVWALELGATAGRLRRLSGIPGIDRRTLARWREWWRASLPAGAFWRQASAAVIPPVAARHLPGALLERFAGGAEDRLIALLRFLAPITGGASLMRAF